MHTALHTDAATALPSPAPDLAPQTTATALHRVIEWLDAHGDIDPRDASFFGVAASLPVEEWTPPAADHAHALATGRYRQQLEDAGWDVDLIPAPPLATPEAETASVSPADPRARPGESASDHRIREACAADPRDSASESALAEAPEPVEEQPATTDKQNVDENTLVRVVAAPDGDAGILAPAGHPVRAGMAEVPGARWDGAVGAWRMAVSRESALALRALLTGHQLGIEPGIAARLKAAANTDPATECPDITLAPDPTGEDGEERIEIRFAHTAARQDDVKRLAKAQWDGPRACWATSTAQVTGVLKFAAAHGFTTAPEIARLAEKQHEPFDYDGTIDGLRGVPVDELDFVRAIPARGEGKKRVGSLAERLADYGVESVYDLLSVIPMRYMDRSKQVPIRDLRVGEKVAFLARVTDVGLYDRAKRMVRIKVADGTGDMTITFFNQSWMAFRFRKGDEVVVYGKVDVWNGGGRSIKQMTNPMMDPVGDDPAMIVPVYPQSEKSKVSTWDLHGAAMEAVRRLGALQDPMPDDLKNEHGLIDRLTAYREVHAPTDIPTANRARTRLAFDELFRMQMALGMRRHAVADETGVKHSPDGSLTTPFVAGLRYELTGAQKRVLGEVREDLLRPHPMHRLLQGDVGAGKAQPLHSLVLTPTGFKHMGEIVVGDDVVTPSGEVTVVTGVYPQGERDVWRVHLCDGTFVDADDEHLWNVNTTTRWHRGSDPKTLTTREIRQDLTNKNGSSKWYLPAFSAPELDAGGDRPLDAYLLGLMLGDGSMTCKAEFTSADPELLDAVCATLPEGCDLVFRAERGRAETHAIVRARNTALIPESLNLSDIQGLVSAYDSGFSFEAIAASVGCDYRSVYDRIRHLVEARPASVDNPMHTALRALGLWGSNSWHKVVPDSYKNAPVKVRHAVLQGLLDTDGGCTRGREVSATWASVQLAEDAAWLARSLGGRASIRPKVVDGVTYHRVSFALPAEFPPFRLTRKAESLNPRTKYANFRRAIRNITHVGTEPVQCIMVADPSHMYVTDNFTPTHNTTIALTSLLMAVEGGFQGALMAPTEILATQLHAELADELAKITHPDGRMLVVDFLGGKTRVKEKRRILAGLADGSIDIVVGTHALFTDDVEFANLGLVVIDEQHRFGVEQRAALRAKGNGGSPDMLLMTATPIPRTSAMSVYGDLAISVLDELPPGRTPIATTWIPGEPELDAITGSPWSEVRTEVEAGRQAYIVASLVEDNEKIAAASAEAALESLEAGALAGLRLGLVHGKQPREEREETMQAFKCGELDVLVATTVIEVGVNVPNATVMVVLDATRFGIAQLHQIRGRVGRGQWASRCFLTGKAGSADAVTRMQALCESTDGFYLSEVDLDLRGEGSIFGSRQSGQTDLRVASLRDDKDLLVLARAEADKILDTDPKLARRPGLRNEVRSAIGEDAEEWLTRS